MNKKIPLLFVFVLIAFLGHKFFAINVQTKLLHHIINLERTLSIESSIPQYQLILRFNEIKNFVSPEFQIYLPNDDTFTYSLEEGLKLYFLKVKKSKISHVEYKFISENSLGLTVQLVGMAKGTTSNGHNFNEASRFELLFIPDGSKFLLKKVTFLPEKK